MSEEVFPEPLVARDVDLSDFQFMPLFIERLRKSKAWLVCKRKPELAFYLLNLWMRAWHESPAGSIENDDDVLADAAGTDVKTWARVKADVLRGWVCCSDGRLYHHVVADLANDAWADKQSYRNRTAAARQAKKQRRDMAATTSVTEHVTEHVIDDVTVVATGLKGKGKGKGKAPSASSSQNLVEVGNAILDAMGTDPARFVGHFGGIAERMRQGATADELIAVAKRLAARPGWQPKRDPIAFLLKALPDQLEAVRAEAAAPPPMTAAEEMRALWAQRLAGFRRCGLWLPAWGPRPDEPGCAASDQQQEAA